MRVIHQRRYDESFKRGAVELLERTDRSLGAVAVDLGVDRKTLRDWYNHAQMAKKGKTPTQRLRDAVSASPVPQSDKERIASLERELESLRRKNAQLEMDREILKKAAAFFAKESL